MATEGNCHCGAVRFTIEHDPATLKDCGCTHCQKRGVLWAYYPPSEVAVTGATTTYRTGDRVIDFHFCPVCGCTTHWTAVDPKRDRMAINGRLLPPGVRAAAQVVWSPGPK